MFKFFKKEFYCYVHRFHLWALTILVILSIIFCINKFVTHALFLIIFGNWITACLVTWLHLKAKTADYYFRGKDYPAEKIRFYLRSLTNLLEVAIFSTFFVFGQILFLTGWLVVKTLWLYDRSDNKKSEADLKDPPGQFVTRQGAARHIFILGLICSLLLAFIIALIIKKACLNHDPIYKAIETMFPKQN